MATEAVEARSDHVRGITVTAIACLAGIAAALVSTYMTADAGSFAAAAEDPLAVYVLGVFIIAQFPVLTVFGIDVNDFSIKDYLYVAFMTFSLWFVSWGILLESGVTI